jgi:hypothetical protein
MCFHSSFNDTGFLLDAPAWRMRRNKKRPAAVAQKNSPEIVTVVDV